MGQIFFNKNRKTREETMKFIFAALISFMLSVPVIAQNHDHSNHGAAKLSASLESELKSILSANDSLFDSLLGKDQAKVESAAASLSKALTSAKSPELKHLTQGNELGKIKKTNTKDQNLEVYAKFVSHLVPILKANKIEGYGIYYCPMIKKEWVQNEKKHSGVKNVFAQEMLECGEKT